MLDDQGTSCFLWLLCPRKSDKEIRSKHRDFTQNCQKVFNCSILGMSLGVICSVCSPLKVETNYVYNVRLACLELYIEICMSQFSQACTFGTRSGLDQR